MLDKKIFQLCNSITEEQALELDKEKYKANTKWDGERVISVILDKDVIMFNRGGKIVNFHFPEIAEELKKLPNCIIDGEIISIDDNFTRLQSRALTQNKDKIQALIKEIPCDYMIFDILKIGEEDLRNKPLKERFEKLFNLFVKNFDVLNPFQFLKVVAYEDIISCLFEAKLKQREGIIIKNMNGLYESRRSDNWKKLKFFKETILILTKYSPNNAGYRCEDNLNNAVQVSGNQSLEVINKIKTCGSCEVYIQYLEKTKNDKYRFISFRGVKK